MDKSHAALIVTDMQYDFMPGGALGVKHGDEIVKGVSALMESGGFGIVVGTVEAGFRTVFVWDLTRAVQPENDGNVRRTLEDQGVEIAEAADIARL